jgi:acyl-CoA dehydrogenase
MNEAQKILEDSVSRLFADSVDRELLTRMEHDPWEAGLWEACVELGLPLVMVSEARDGMGGGWVEGFIVARACGQHAVPLPVVEQMLAGYLADRAGLAVPDGVAGLLPSVIPGAAITGSSVSMIQRRVPWGRRADWFVGLTAEGELLVLGKEGSSCQAETNLAREPRDQITLQASPILARGPAGVPADAIRWLGALLRSAQIAGSAAACLEMSVKYTSDREQFGRKLSQFQAIQHHLAEIAGQMASVDTIAMAACVALEQRGLGAAGRDARFELAAAKCRASEAVEPLTRLSHQVHGAIGFTYEYDLQFLTRRLWSWRAEFGAHGEWGEYLGSIAQREGGDGIWAYMTA